MESTLIKYFKNQDFTTGQRRIAQYMLEHEYELARMSLMDVSREVGVSDASVLRFVREIGFDGWNDFKSRLYERMTERVGRSAADLLRLSDRLCGSLEESSGTDLQSSASEAGNRVVASLLQNSPEDYESVAGAIRDSRRVFVYGCRGTSAVSEQFAYALRFNYASASVINSTHGVHGTLINADKRDCFVFFCASRFYHSDELICRHASSSGIKFCLITDVLPSPVSKYATLLLLARTSHRNYFNSMLGMMAVAEYLLKILSSGEAEARLRERLDVFDKATNRERIE